LSDAMKAACSVSMWVAQMAVQMAACSAAYSVSNWVSNLVYDSAASMGDCLVAMKDVWKAGQMDASLVDHWVAWKDGR